MRRIISLLGALGLLTALSAEADDLPLRSGTATRLVRVPAIGVSAEEAAWRAVASLGELAPAADDNPHSMLRGDLRAAFDDTHLVLQAVLRGRMRTVARAFEGERFVFVLDPRNEHAACLAIEATLSAAPGVRVVGGPSEAFGLTDVRVAARATADEWRIEVAIPWKALGASPTGAQPLGFDALRFAADGKVLRWSRVAGANDIDPRVTGLLWAGAPRLVVEQAWWPTLHAGANSARLTVRNTSDQPLRLTLVTITDRALSASRSGSVDCNLAAAEARAVDVPVSVAASGRLGLRFEAHDRDAPDLPLYRARYFADAEARFAVRGIGWLELRPTHRLAGETPLGFRLRALECRPTPASQPPVHVELVLEGPDGPGCLERARTDLDLEAIELATLDREFVFDTAELLSGAYRLRARVTRGSTVLGESEQEVRVSRVIEEDLGFTGPQRSLVGIRDSLTATVAAKRGAATLDYRIRRAWQVVDGTAATTDDEFIATANAARGELNEAKAVAADLERGVRPYAGKAGTFLLAHYSPVDDTPQPYALYVPETYSDQRASPVVLQLHGYDGGNGGFGYSGGDDPLKQEAKARGWLMLYPWGRGNQDWRDSGDTDLFALLRDLSILYGIDESRLFLTGISMGGRGVWHLAARHPDTWAGIVPIAGASSGQVWTVWQEERLACNYRALPAYIVHGGADSIVPIEDARTMYQRMLDEGYDVRFQEYATRGHEGFGDFAPTLFAWMDGLRRNPWPSVVRYDTEWLRWSSAYWVRIEGLEREGQLSSIEARVEGPTRITVRTDKLTDFALELSGHPLLDRTRPLVLEVDGAEVHRDYLPANGVLSLAKGVAGWKVVAPRGARFAKGSLTSGPMRRVFGDRFHVVYGTQGWDDEKILTSYDMARRAAERWEWWIWGAMRPIADRDATTETLGSGGLLLYGGPETNLATRHQLAVHDPGLPPGTAWRVGRPSRWNPTYLAAVFEAPSSRALRAMGDLGEAWPLPSAPMAAQDADYHVCTIDSEQRLTPWLEGCSPVDWSLPLAEEGLLLATDASWRATHLAAGDWRATGYDDSAWLTPQVRLRKEFDETCWHYAALHKYGRLSQSFLPPVMSLKARVDPARPLEPSQVSYFRKEFDLREVPARVVLRAYLDDEGEVYVNGKLVCALGLADLVREFDITNLLAPGRNTVAVRIANTQYDECICLQITEEEPTHAAP
jgi:predicted esterase